jgi:hypothetical protein
MSTSLGEMFGRFRRSAFRCESRDSYLMTDLTRFNEWQARGRLPRKTRENDSWIATIEDATARDATISRVRLVGHPITPYTQFEFAAFRDNVLAGERISVAERRLMDPSWQEVTDFWLFDDNEVFVQHYDDHGGFLGAHPVDDPAPFIEVRDMLRAVGVPFEGYSLSDLPPRPGHERHPRVGQLPRGLIRARS